MEDTIEKLQKLYDSIDNKYFHFLLGKNVIDRYFNELYNNGPYCDNFISYTNIFPLRFKGGIILTCERDDEHIEIFGEQG
jgi:hypothetical protein